MNHEQEVNAEDKLGVLSVFCGEKNEDWRRETF